MQRNMVFFFIMRRYFFILIPFLPIVLQAQKDIGASITVGIAHRTVPNINKIHEAVIPGESVGFDDQFFGIDGSLNVFAGHNCFFLRGTLTGSKLKTKDDQQFQPYLGSLSLEYGLLVTDSKRILIYPSVGGGLLYSMLSSAPKKSTQPNEIKIFSRFSSLSEFAVNVYAPLKNEDEDEGGFTGSLLGLRLAVGLYPNYGNWSAYHGDGTQTETSGASRRNLIGFAVSLTYGVAHFP